MTAEYRALMGVIVALAGSGVVSSVIPGLENAIGAVVLGVPLAAGAVWAVRREVRIRARIADTTGTTRVDTAPCIESVSSRAAVEDGCAHDIEGVAR